MSSAIYTASTHQWVLAVYAKIRCIKHPLKSARTHAMIVMEKLGVSRMSMSAKGHSKKQGTHVKAKSGLNKSILDAGWSMFAAMLEYKQTWRGGSVQYVNPAYTSQRCSKCGHTEKDNRVSQSKFKCQQCGYTQNADRNAAINI